MTAGLEAPWTSRGARAAVTRLRCRGVQVADDDAAVRATGPWRDSITLLEHAAA